MNKIGSEEADHPLICQTLSTIEHNSHHTGGDRYVLGFPPALYFPRRQILCRLYKCPSDETINLIAPCVHACKKVPCTHHGVLKVRQAAEMSLHKDKIGMLLNVLGCQLTY